MGTVYGVRDRVIVKRPGVKSARQFKHVNRLLTELRGRYHGLLLRSFIGEAGLPGIKGEIGLPGLFGLNGKKRFKNYRF